MHGKWPTAACNIELCTIYLIPYTLLSLFFSPPLLLSFPLFPFFSSSPSPFFLSSLPPSLPPSQYQHPDGHVAPVRDLLGQMSVGTQTPPHGTAPHSHSSSPSRSPYPTSPSQPAQTDHTGKHKQCTELVIFSLLFLLVDQLPELKGPADKLRTLTLCMCL